MMTTTRRQFMRMAATLSGTMWLGLTPARLTATRRRNIAPPTTVRPNILMVTVDALRADHISAYGYPRVTTPNLDAWIAAQGVRYLHATTTSPWTYGANAAMVTGLEPTQLSASWNSIGLPTDVTTLAERLGALGYQTAGFVSAVLTRGALGFDRGFDHFDDSLTYTNLNEAQGLAGRINDLVSTWLDTERNETQPLFLYLYYFDPHSWYNPPAPYDTLFDNSYSGPLTPAIIQDCQPFVSGTVTPTEQDIDHVKALYDGEIAYWDTKFGELLTDLQNRSLLDNTLVTVSADHGESFGEHGKWAHASSLFEEAMRVPLLLRYPGVITPDSSVSSPVSNIDLFPTILDYAGFSGEMNISGRSLRPFHEQITPQARDIFCELDGMNDPAHWIYWNATRTDLRAIYRDNWKYIHHVGNSRDDELYLVGDSPNYETDNLLTNEPDLALELRNTILNHYALWREHLPFVTS